MQTEDSETNTNFPTKMAANDRKRAMRNGQYWVFYCTISLVRKRIKEVVFYVEMLSVSIK